VLRELRPRVVILPYWKGRHPDHYTASTLGYEACFLAGLGKLEMSRQSPAGGEKPAISIQHSALSPAAPSQSNVGHQPASAEPDSSGKLAPHRPFKIIYATLYYDVRPTFVVDITDQFEARFASLMAYKTQFSDQEAGKELFPAQKEIRARVEAMARFYGMLGGVDFAEPFVQKEVGLVDDLLMLPVKSI
jgi:LmbE family N-acetylglucosaminyl deacetylase